MLLVDDTALFDTLIFNGDVGGNGAALIGVGRFGGDPGN